MGNCQNLCGKPRLRASILVVGLDNAGKTTLSKILQKLPIHSIAPTVGYASDEFKFNNFMVSLIDVGGGKNIRGIWKNYFAEIHGLVYVVDSSEHERLEEAKTELTQLLSNDLISGKPVLLLANKQDKSGALDEFDICEKLNLEAIVNEYKCLCKVEMTSAMFDKKEKAVKLGLKWLLSVIEQDFVTLNDRVNDDIKKRDVQIEEEMTARRTRIKLRKEEMAAREAEENSRKNLSSSQSKRSNSASKAEESPHRTSVPSEIKPSSSPEQIQPKSSTPSSMEKMVHSGLGDELLDDVDLDDTEFNLPGSVPPSRNSTRNHSKLSPHHHFSSRHGEDLAPSEDAMETIHNQNSSKHSENSTPWSFVNTTDANYEPLQSRGNGSIQQNLVSPISSAQDQGALPMPTGLSSKKLAPLNNPRKLSDASDSNKSLPMLPPLLFAKPNAEDDVIV